MSEERDPKSPVAWLLGPQLLATLKQTALYLAFEDRLDPRDWMSAEVVDLDVDSEDEFWFDYFADSGDGQTAMYSVAALCLSELHSSDEPGVGTELSLGAGAHTLPRGRFLFVGGDTAYHVADVRTLKERFVRPFNWACSDLGLGEADSRPLFAIPGNHDWYDSLDGFRSQFRVAADLSPHTHDERSTPSGSGVSPEPDPLAIHALHRRQQASYVALHLPHDWWFVGMDAQHGKLDGGQRAFFSRLDLGEKSRLILATPEPATVFGKRRGSVLRESLESVGIRAPLESGAGLPPDRIRLDLSGDIHHYARYWGPSDERPGVDNYASVVSGLGGAFLHSPTTDFGEVPAEAIYPERAAAREVFASELFRFWNVMRGGYVWLFGGIFALIAYFGLLVSDSGRSLLAAVVPGEVPTPQGFLLEWLHRETFTLPDAGAGVLLRSFLFLLFLVGSGLLMSAANALRNRLAKRDRVAEEYVRTLDQIPVVLCVAGAVALPFLGMWFFGRHPAAILVSDILLLVVLASPLGFAALAAVVAGGNVGARGKFLFALLGLAHGLLQILTPFLLAWRFSWIAHLVTFAAVPLFAYLGYRTMRANRRGWLLVIFLGQMVALLGVSTVAGGNQPADWIGLLLAFAWGAVLSCVWFGWYLAVSLAFHGHNNEAGGAARIELFKEFIRARLTRDELTAWVIAVDEPTIDLSELRPRVVDRFTLRASPAD